MKNLIILTSLILVLQYGYSQSNCDFDQVMKMYHERFDNNRFDEAIAIINEALTEFPDKHYEINKELAIAYGYIGEFNKSFEIWNEGFAKGYYYCIIPQWDDYKPFNGIDGFDKIYEKDRAIREAAIQNNLMESQIIKPLNYDSTKKYPLLIVLHGGGSSNKTSMKYWRSSNLRNDYVVAFLQSYLLYDMKTYGWSWDRPRTKTELKNVFEKIRNEYSIDTARVIIGGMSAGGYVAIRAAIHNLFPNSGFIAVCPDLRWGYPELMEVKESTRNNTKGYIISGEKDMCLESIENWIALLNESSFDYKFKMINDLGHEYPIEFSEEIEMALEFINKEK